MMSTGDQTWKAETSLARVAVLGRFCMRALFRRRPGKGELGGDTRELFLPAVLHDDPAEGGRNAAVVDDEIVDQQRVDLGHTGVEAQITAYEDLLSQIAAGQCGGCRCQGLGEIVDVDT